MDPRFCARCDKPLPSDARFCAGCGTPVAAEEGPSSAPQGSRSASSPTNRAGASAFEAPPCSGADPAAAAPALSVALGLKGTTNFLLQHLLFSGARNYRVLDHQKRHLCTVKEDVREELITNVPTGPATPSSGPPPWRGRNASPEQTLYWQVADSRGTSRAKITIQESGGTSVSTLARPSGAPILAVTIARGPAGGLSATAAFPDGRPMFTTQGNLLRHDFTIHDATGASVAKVHEARVSLRDTYNLDLVGGAEPLCALVFAILLDREKRATEE